MKVNAYMLAFGEGKIREIDIPDAEVQEVKGDQHTILELAFRYGQNDFQPRRHPSVSVGDIIQLGEKYFMVMGAGWSEMSKEQLDTFIKMKTPTSDIGYGFTPSKKQT